MKKIKFNGWALLSTIISLMIVLPNIDIIIHLFQKPNKTWYHIKEYLLKDYIVTSIIVVFFTVLLSIIIGVTLAWFISAYDFPFRKFFRWALILPLAIPPYIGAYTYSGMVSYTGVIQRFFRSILGVELNQKYFDIMSIEGAIFIFTLFLFPYVYMVTMTFLEKQSAGLIESARLLGSSAIGIFFRVIIPVSRGAIVAGSTLIALEVLSDYGVVSYLGVQTFSTAIFKSWISLGDVDSAIRLAGILMVVVFIIISSEKALRGRKKYSFTNTKVRPIKRKNLKGFNKFIVTLYVLIIFSLGFLIPVLQMIAWAIASYKNIYYSQFLSMIFNSVILASGCSLLIVIMALIVANYVRTRSGLLSKIYAKVTLIGYSIPGAVVAITMILFFVDIDNKIKGLALSTSIIMLVFAYVIRFLAIGYQNIEGGFEKIGNKFTEASRTLGYGVTKTFFKVDIHMLKPAILGAFALTFVDIIKELPLVLTLRPFNFYTLSTKVFEYANDEMIPESAIPSLIIVFVSFVAIYFLYKVADKED